MLTADRYSAQNVATEVVYFTSGSTAGTVLTDYSNIADFILNVTLPSPDLEAGQKTDSFSWPKWHGFKIGEGSDVNYVNLLQAQVQYELTSNIHMPAIDTQIITLGLASWSSMIQNKPLASLIEKTSKKQNIATLRPITMEEAQNMASNVLLAAEKRRQNERQREADFWISLED